MKIIRHKAYTPSYDKIILSGDIGGTNSNLALTGVKGSAIEILTEVIEDSSLVKDFTATTKAALEVLLKETPQAIPQICCISAAGPVKDNCCKMTNQSWTISGPEIEKALGIPTLIINDFMAVSYSLPLLNTQDSSQITILHRPKEGSPHPQGEMRAVAGAGTGLGVGFIIKTHEKYLAFPSEGGHMDFADFDPLTKELKAYIYDQIDLVPEYEQLISGMGIKNLFYYFAETGRLDKKDGAIMDIYALPDTQKPAKIAQEAKTHPGLRSVMVTFVKMYARFCASTATMLLPFGGLYLAGGIVGKNLEFFTENHLFINTFEEHCNPNIRKLLKEIPVFVINDYSISLLGAANAALSLI